VDHRAEGFRSEVQRCPGRPRSGTASGSKGKGAGLSGRPRPAAGVVTEKWSQARRVSLGERRPLKVGGQLAEPPARRRRAGLLGELRRGRSLQRPGHCTTHRELLLRPAQGVTSTHASRKPAASYSSRPSRGAGKHAAGGRSGRATVGSAGFLSPSKWDVYEVDSEAGPAPWQARDFPRFSQ